MRDPTCVIKGQGLADVLHVLRATMAPALGFSGPENRRNTLGEGWGQRRIPDQNVKAKTVARIAKVDQSNLSSE